MVGAIVSASTGVMNLLLDKLSTLLEQEYARHKKLQKNVRFLRDELSSINAVLQKYAEMANPEVQVKAWMKEVRELAYDIEDSIDAFMVYVDQKSDEPAAGTTGFVCKIIDKVKELVVRNN